MTLKRYFLLVLATLAVFACSPGITPDDDGDRQQPDPQQQTDPQDEAFADVRIEDVEDVTETGATLQGSFGRATAVPDEAGFEWGVAADNLDGKVQSTASISGQAGRFSAVLSKLSPETKYFFRAYVRLNESLFYSDVEYFTTAASATPPVAISQPGWYELPKMDMKQSGKYLVNTDNAALYYAMHICPDVYGPVSGRLARNYTVCYDSDKHCTMWVAAPRHSMYSVKNVSRTDAYGPDPDVPAELQYSSKSTGGDCNKGHMLGSAERLVSRATNVQVFYYTNIAPQLSANFNTGGGRWNVLEDYVDTQVCADTLYETLGCYFESYTDAYGESQTPATISFGSRDDVIRPTMFYYILLRTKSGNSGKALSECSTSELKCVAFVRAHVNVRQAVTATDLMSVSDLEKITGVTYFVNVPQAPKDTFNASDWGL